MDEKNLLAERFEAHRSRLRGVAYRMLGSEANDAVQEVWPHLSRTGDRIVEVETIADPKHLGRLNLVAPDADL